jgi:hypothetical protein
MTTYLADVSSRSTQVPLRFIQVRSDMTTRDISAKLNYFLGPNAYNLFSNEK